MHTCMERARWAPFLCRPLKKEKKEQKTRERKKKKGRWEGFRIQDGNGRLLSLFASEQRCYIIINILYIIYIIQYEIEQYCIVTSSLIFITAYSKNYIIYLFYKIIPRIWTSNSYRTLLQVYVVRVLLNTYSQDCIIE